MVVDTMVLAFALIGEAEHHRRAVEALATADDLWAPDSIRAELVNVLWRWVYSCSQPEASDQSQRRRSMPDFEKRR